MALIDTSSISKSGNFIHRVCYIITKLEGLKPNVTRQRFSSSGGIPRQSARFLSCSRLLYLFPLPFCKLSQQVWKETGAPKETRLLGSSNFGIGTPLQSIPNFLFLRTEAVTVWACATCQVLWQIICIDFMVMPRFMGILLLFTFYRKKN